MSTLTIESHRETSTPLTEPAWAAALGTEPGLAATIARLSLGAMIQPHGLQKAFGILGGAGFGGTMAYFTETLGIPWILAFLAIAAELVGGIGLLLGLGGRIAAAGVGTVMIVAALMNHVEHGFFMNWFGNMPAGSEGWEFHLLAVGLAVVVMLRGSGAFSVDRAVTKRSGRDRVGPVDR